MYILLPYQTLNFLLEKYGVIPKKCFPESHTTEASRRMNDILNHKVQHMEQGGIEISILTLKFLTDSPKGIPGHFSAQFMY